MTKAQQRAGKADLAQPRDDLVLPFQIAPLGVRGRLIRVGEAVNEVVRRHDYPEPVAGLLAEAVALTGLLGASLKFDGKFIFQTKTDGPVSFLVVDYTTPGKLRGMAHFDAAAVAKLEREGTAPPDHLLGKGHLAMTIDRGGDMDRYQGVVALEGQSLSVAAEAYFRQSEQLPTAVKLASAPLLAPQTASWRAGGILIQHLPDTGGSRLRDLDPGDRPEGVEPAMPSEPHDDWVKACALLGTVEDHELLDPTLTGERLLYRLYHEDGVRVFEDQPLSWHCHCSRERINDMLTSFSEDDRAYMIKDGVVTVTCEFCAATYRFDPAEIESV